MLAILIIAAIIAVYFIFKLFDPKKENESARNDTPSNIDNGVPAQLLDLDKTTIADRQRAYHRGYRTQMRYDILQRRAELAGDTATLEAIRTNTYNGPLPELGDDKPTNKMQSKPTNNPTVQELKYFCIKDKGYHVTVWPKDQYKPDYLEFEIAGMSYRDNIDNYLGEHKGTLEAEPTNEYDPNAIKILAEDGHHVGYVSKDMTASIREFTTLPCTCYFYIGNNSGTYYSDAYINRE